MPSSNCRTPLVVMSIVFILVAYVSQISRPVEASQALVSSSRLTIPSLPDGGRCCGQTSNMWSTVCSGAPHSQTEESLKPHFSMDELNRPTPVRRRLRVVHCFRGKSRPGTLCGSRMKLCSLEEGAASQSSFQVEMKTASTWPPLQVTAPAAKLMSSTSLTQIVFITGWLLPCSTGIVFVYSMVC